MARNFDSLGRIRCGTILCPDLAASEADYRDVLGLDLIDQQPVSEALAAAWGAPAMAGRATRLLRAPDATPYATRLVEGTAVAGYRPLSSYGWAAFEHSVANCDALYERIKTSAFTVVGAPKLVPGFDNFIPFQVIGRAGEVLYLNQVLSSEMSDLDLPKTDAVVDQMFIAILAAQDRGATVAFHVAALGFEEGQTWTIPYSVINKSFGLDPATATDMTMTKTGRTPACEIDQYPAAATVRAVTPGELPPGNAMVSFIAGSLDALRVPLLGPPVRIDNDLYAGRRAACVRGPSGELIELIEAL
jgi:catechol 2,3-dioxygenase-like lactoylglutathione lyase family enzyme